MNKRAIALGIIFGLVAFGTALWWSQRRPKPEPWQTIYEVVGGIALTYPQSWGELVKRDAEIFPVDTVSVRATIPEYTFSKRSAVQILLSSIDQERDLIAKYETAAKEYALYEQSPLLQRSRVEILEELRLKQPNHSAIRDRILKEDISYPGQEPRVVKSVVNQSGTINGVVIVGLDGFDVSPVLFNWRAILVGQEGQVADLSSDFIFLDERLFDEAVRTASSFDIGAWERFETQIFTSIEKGTPEPRLAWVLETLERVATQLEFLPKQ